MRRTRTLGISLFGLSLVLASCEKQSAPAPSASATAAPSGTSQAASAITAKDLDMLSHRKAKELLVSRGWRAANASTGPKAGAFSISTNKEDGSKVEVEMFVFGDPIEKDLARPRAIKDAVFAEHAMKLLSVRLKRQNKVDDAAGKTLLDALVARARNPEEPFAVVRPAGSTWLDPSIETVDAYLVISPKLIAKVIAALTALGCQDAVKNGEQKRNTKNPRDTGYPGAFVRARRGDDSIEVDLRCLPEDSSPQFFPQPGDADLGEAIYTKDRCKVVVAVKTGSALWSDKAKAKALLEQLFAHHPKGE
jgi:hypothetical protein